ncbi:integrase, catalytic region, zinc finger, CCHC-type containing protein [Tanacetum coccineum]
MKYGGLLFGGSCSRESLLYTLDSDVTFSGFEHRWRDAQEASCYQRTDFESLATTLRLYCLGNGHIGENIMMSHQEVQFIWERSQDVITGGTDVQFNKVLVRASVLNDLSAEVKERYKVSFVQPVSTSRILRLVTKLINDMRKHMMTIPGCSLKLKVCETTCYLSGVDSYGSQRLKERLKEYANFEQYRNNARGNGITGNVGGQNRGGMINHGQAKPIKCYNCNGLGHIARECPRPKRIQDSDYFKDKMLLMQAQERGAVLDEEQLLFLAGEQVTNVDDDVDDSPENDLALNVDHVFEADECDAFDSDVDEGPITQTMFMINLTSEDLIYDEAGTSYDSNTPSELQSALYNGPMLLVTTTLTPTVLYDSDDNHDNNRKKAETLAPKPISALTVYPPNTPVKLVPRILPTKSQERLILCTHYNFLLNLTKLAKLESPQQVLQGERGFEQTKDVTSLDDILFFKTLKVTFGWSFKQPSLKKFKELEEIFVTMNNEVDKIRIDKQCAEIEKKNLLIENENLIVNCLSTQLLYDVEKSHCLDFEADMSKVHDVVTTSAEPHSPSNHLYTIENQTKGRKSREIKKTVQAVKSVPGVPLCPN